METALPCSGKLDHSDIEQLFRVKVKLSGRLPERVRKLLVRLVTCA